jgi:hypothetical protein
MSTTNEPQSPTHSDAKPQAGRYSADSVTACYDNYLWHAFIRDSDDVIKFAGIAKDSDTAKERAQTING